MTTSEQRRPARAAEYFYRRPLGIAELLPAVVAGVGVGLAAFYVARVLLQRTPLLPDLTRSEPRPVRRRPSGARGG